MIFKIARNVLATLVQAGLLERDWTEAGRFKLTAIGSESFRAAALDLNDIHAMEDVRTMTLRVYPREIEAGVGRVDIRSGDDDTKIMIDGVDFECIRIGLERDYQADKPWKVTLEALADPRVDAGHDHGFDFDEDDEPALPSVNAAVEIATDAVSVVTGFGGLPAASPVADRDGDILEPAGIVIAEPVTDGVVENVVMDTRRETAVQWLRRMSDASTLDDVGEQKTFGCVTFSIPHATGRVVPDPNVPLYDRRDGRNVEIGRVVAVRPDGDRVRVAAVLNREGDQVVRALTTKQVVDSLDPKQIVDFCERIGHTTTRVSHWLAIGVQLTDTDVDLILAALDREAAAAESELFFQMRRSRLAEIERVRSLFKRLS